VVSIGIILALFFITLHYHSHGPKNIPFVPSSGEVPRFTVVERGVHLFRLLSFVILAITGLILAFSWSHWQDLLFSSPKQMLNIHIWSGVVFIVTTLFGIGLWWRDAIFASYDKIWVRMAGGYLGHKGDVEIPAGRFNAGQKMFYWYSGAFSLVMAVTGLVLIFKTTFALSVICLTSTVHNLFGFILIAGILSHAYLGTVANPGTWRVLVDGFVTRVWARHHHPNWYRALIEEGTISGELSVRRRKADKETGESEENDQTQD
jgi:formate dehydrogenase subunit gamma